MHGQSEKIPGYHSLDAIRASDRRLADSDCSRSRSFALSSLAMSFLKRHPFPVRAHFDRVIAVSFAFPQDALVPLVPAGLDLDCYENLGFVTVALVWTRHLRPEGFPRSFGRSFFLAGYRVFTRMQNDDGRQLRGLRILRSETDKRTMVLFGNWMTAYNYRQIHLQMDRSGTETRIRTSLADGATTLDLTFDADTPDAGLPDGSPFPDWRTARRFAGPMPFTFSPEPDGRVVVIEGRRADWKPRPIRIMDCSAALFREGALKSHTPILANAFAVENIEYHWSRGRLIRPGKS